MDLEQKTSELISYLEQVAATQSPTTFACSFGAEDMVLLDMIAKHARKIEIFTLDTGRLPEETQALLETVRDKYPIAIRTYFPDTAVGEAWVEQNGPNGFYKSVAQRQQCCHIRKVRTTAAGACRQEELDYGPSARAIRKPGRHFKSKPGTTRTA